MKIALLNPEAPVNRFDFKGFLGEPLGLLYIASVLERHGHDVRVFDLQMNPKLDIIKEIGNYIPDLIGITSMTANFYKAKKTANYIRQKFSIFTVLGGVHATFTSNELAQHPEFDAYVQGEGESTMLELINTLKEGDNLSNVDGLVYKANGMPVYNKPRPLIDNLDTIPYPARHLIDMNSYISHKGSAALITTRGCPYSCIYCSTSKMHGNRYRTRGIENVIKEIEIVLDAYAPPRLSFVDDNFTFNRQRVRMLCKAIEERKFEIPWSCNARVDNIDEDLLKLMKESGCEEILFGIESGSQDILNKIKKGFTRKHVERAMKLAKEIGIKTAISLVLGLPGENRNTIKETIQFIKSINPDSCTFFFATPFPGTYLHTNMETLGYRMVDDNLSHFTCTHPVIETEDVSISDLQSAWIEAGLQFSKKVR